MKYPDPNEILKIYSEFERELHLYSVMYEEIGVTDYLKEYTKDGEIDVYTIIGMKNMMRSKGFEVLLPNPKDKFVNIYRQIEINWDDVPIGQSVYSKNPFVNTLIDLQYSSLGTQMNKNRSQSEFVVISFASLIENIFARLASLVLEKDSSNKFLNDLEIDYKTLSSFDSLKDAKEFLVSKKISNLMFKAFNSWSRDIMKIVSPQLQDDRELKVVIETLNEMYARRNIYIHNKGKVNEMYLGLVGGRSEFRKEKLGSYLRTDQNYLNIIENNAWRLVTSLVFELVNKGKTDISEISQSLTEIGLKLYKNKKFDSGTLLFKQATSLIRSEYAEDSFEVYMMNYNEMLGYKLGENINAQNKIDMFIEFFQNKVSWWDTTEAQYTDFALKSLILDRKEFLKESINFIQETMNKDKKTVANMITWPMFQLIEDFEEWKEFVDTVYDWGLQSN